MKNPAAKDQEPAMSGRLTSVRAKAMMLVVLPILMTAAVGLGGMHWMKSENSEGIASLNEEAVEIADVVEDVGSFSVAMQQLGNEASRSMQNHQTGIISTDVSRSKAASDRLSELRDISASLSDHLDPLRHSIEWLTIQREDQKSSNHELIFDQSLKQSRYLLRKYEYIQQLLNSVIESNSRTVAFFAQSMRSEARNNFVYEEQELFRTLNNQIAKMSEIAVKLQNNLLEIGRILNRNQSDRTVNSVSSIFNKTAISLLFGMMLVIAAGLMVANWLIVNPLNRIAGAVDQLNEGRFNFRLNIRNRDEIGHIASAINQARNDAEIRQRLQVTSDFAEHLQNIVGNLNSITENVTRSANSLDESSSATSGRSSSATAMVKQSTNDIQIIADASNRMASTSDEVVRRIENIVEMVALAVSRSTESQQSMTQLVESSNRIGDIVSVITSVAEQTNLLALNATIEAARAGDAGRGFAVVAQEVKSLALQTSAATGSISEQVKSIQEASSGAIVSLERIQEAVKSMSEASSAISNASLEQSKTVTDVTSKVSSVSRNSEQIDREISTVKDEAFRTKNIASHLQDASRQLSEQVKQLDHHTDKFSNQLSAG